MGEYNDSTLSFQPTTIFGLLSNFPDMSGLSSNPVICLVYLSGQTVNYFCRDTK